MNNSHVEKICFVTVGATASFDDLIRAVIDRKFILELIKAGYTKIVVQYGKTGSALFHECQQKAGPVDIEIEGFDFKSGDFRDAVEVVTASDRRKEGVMIAHAGTGSLLDGLHFQIPTVLVPNHSLADNHQEELAKKFAGMKLCIYGGFSDLWMTIQDVEIWREEISQQRLRRGVNQKANKTTSQGIWTVLDQEIGYIDRHLD